MGHSSGVAWVDANQGECLEKILKILFIVLKSQLVGKMAGKTQKGDQGHQCWSGLLESGFVIKGCVGFILGRY